MGLFQMNWHGSRHVMQLLILNLICWLLCFCYTGLAKADLSGNAFQSLNFPMEAIMCLFNILVFSESLMRGRLGLEICGREVLATLTRPELKTIKESHGHEIGLTTCMQGRLQTSSVLMLSNGTPISSMRHFMQSNAVDDVHSTLLKFLPLNDARNDPVFNLAGVTDCTSNLLPVFDVPKCRTSECQCNCIVVCTVTEITTMFALRMPQTMKSLSPSACLLPCHTCLINGCHGSNAEGPLPGSCSNLVAEILDKSDSRSIKPGERICICITVSPADKDDWTELLVRSLRPKASGVEVDALEAMEHYLDGYGRRGYRRSTKHKIDYVNFIVSSLCEILINLALTFLFRVDGFSSSLLARRAIREYIVKSERIGLAPNAFLTDVMVNASDTDVSQVLSFRGNLVGSLTLTFIGGGVNLICSIGWAVLIANENGDIYPPPSVTRAALTIAAIGIACFVDCFCLYWYYLSLGKKFGYKVLLVIISEIVCIVVLATALLVKVFGKWGYGILQGLVWIKWAAGNCILDKHFSKHHGWAVMVYSSAFLLNAALLAIIA